MENQGKRRGKQMMKKMREQKGVTLKQLLIGVLAVICVIAIIVVVTNNKNKNEKKGEAAEGETMVQQLEDGTRLNTSEELDKTKTVEGLEVGDIQVTEKNGVSVILANVTNNTAEEKGGFRIDITFTDTSGNVLRTVPGYIKKLKAGETTQLNTSATLDFVEQTYDVTITKAK